MKHRLTRLLSTSKPDIHKETAGEIKRKLSIRPQEASRTCREGYEPTQQGIRSTRKRNAPKKYDDYWLGSTTRLDTESSETSGRETRIMDSRLRDEIKRRGIQKYLSLVNQFTDEETDVEVIHERKNILMSGMEYIFEKLLQMERKGAKRTDFPSDEEETDHQ